jgi:integrase
MARKHQRLTALSIARAAKAGYYLDGEGLYLQVTASGAKSWILCFTRVGKRREMGLGPFPTVTLAAARLAASAARALVKSGQDPIAARNAERARLRLEVARGITFDEATRQFLAAHEPTWKNPKHRQQWRNTLKTYASPKIGNLSVGAISTGEVTRVLDPIWHKKPVTASRLRERIERILDWSKVRGYRTGENPARWRGHLDAVFPAPTKVRKVKHLAAVPIDDMPTVYARLREADGISALAARFTILTAVRVGETTGAVVPEFAKSDVWSISAERMKADRGHNVPLSREAKAVLKEAAEFRVDDRMFPGLRADRPLSHSAVIKALRAAGAGKATTHGCRSTFKDWASERTSFAPEVSEMALAHTIGDKTEAAYRRGELLEKRRALMEAWAQFVCLPASAKVVQIGRRPG